MGLRDDFNMRWKDAEHRFSEEVKQTKADLTIKFRKEYGKLSLHSFGYEQQSKIRPHI